MGTRSTTGVRIDGADKLSYNQFDGYPEGVGQGLIKELKSDIEKLGLDGAIGTWKQLARTMQLVHGATPPTAQQIEKLKPFTDLGVSRGSTDDWYCLLREAQGSLLKSFEAGYMLDAGDFINDSLMCEWGYILNLDDEVLEIYEGYQKAPHTSGRYGIAAGDTPSYISPGYRIQQTDGTFKQEQPTSYYACALIGTIPIAEIPSIGELVDHLLKIGALKPAKDDSAAANAAAE